MSETPKNDPNLEVINFLLSSFTDNGRSLRAFTTNPQELAINPHGRVTGEQQTDDRARRRNQIRVRHSRPDPKARGPIPVDAVPGQYRQCFSGASTGHRARLGR